MWEFKNYIVSVRGHFMIFVLCKPTNHFFSTYGLFFSVYTEEGKGMFICMLCLQCLVYLGPKQKLLNAVRSSEYKF